MEQGFEAASMNDITRAAGVSKGTIYVYFENKEDLFGYMIERERGRITETVRHALDGNKPIGETLHGFGTLFATHMTADQTIRANGGNATVPCVWHGRIILSKLPSTVAANATTSGLFQLEA